MYRNQLISICFLLSLTYGFAQSYTIQKLSIKEGLSQGMITSLCQDSDGFIWVGTLNGLNRFDGTQFKTFVHNRQDPFSLIGNLVFRIFEDSKGRIWVSYDNGIDCYDRVTIKMDSTHLPII